MDWYKIVPSRVADGHQQETQVAEALLEQIGEIYGNVCCLRYIAKSQNKVRLFDRVLRCRYCFDGELNVKFLNLINRTRPRRNLASIKATCLPVEPPRTHLESFYLTSIFS